ncbi:MAG: hypothetical protein IPF72_10165 [Chitinophagaceae bacterium]|nr:hypothetical protein [Chitinophagaceae bacterium]
MKRIFNFLLAGTALLVVMNGLEACSKKSTSSKTTVTPAAEPAAKETTPPPSARGRKGRNADHQGCGW